VSKPQAEAVPRTPAPTIDFGSEVPPEGRFGAKFVSGDPPLRNYRYKNYSVPIKY